MMEPILRSPVSDMTFSIMCVCYSKTVMNYKKDLKALHFQLGLCSSAAQSLFIYLFLFIKQHDFPQYWEDDWIEMFPTFQGRLIF